MSHARRIATELGLPERGVAAVVTLLADKNTVPFIARYRKEASGGLDEVQIRAIDERRQSHVALESRRAVILETIAEQGALSAELRAQLMAATSKAELEDLYLPFKKKRRTRAMKARERGLEPLATRILSQPDRGRPEREAAAFVGPEIPDASAALAGARDIVAEIVAETASVRERIRVRYRQQGRLRSKPARGKAKVKSKFERFYDFVEPVATIPSHRYLAIARGQSEGMLSAKIEIEPGRAEREIEGLLNLKPRSPFARELGVAIADSLKRLLGPSLETEIRAELKERSDRAAAQIFADNLAKLLLSAPLGAASVIGIDPGLRTGCKCAVLDRTGKFLTNTTLYLAGSEDVKHRAERDLTALLDRFDVQAIAVGNGTGGREAEAFARKLVGERPEPRPVVVSVSESGASIYSASEIARDEFPDLDLTIRGAISIGRRLQDPLAELVKVDPKSIGVGQYQHDVDQTLLSDKLRDVVESCVNRVGVDLNTASAALLGHVSGIANSVAKKIVAYRDSRGAFGDRRKLLDVSGLGPRAFEQAAGFLRIHKGANPLDGSAVHPERYDLVERMAHDLGVELASLVGNADLAKSVNVERYIDEAAGVGEPTLRDIIAELDKPGRDPRQIFEAVAFRDDIQKMTDLVSGMELAGVVTNVTAFGAFVDIGVHQDGLVHISELADRFVKDPAEVVSVGDRLQVRVLSVDVARKRIALSAKLGAKQGGRDAAPRSAKKSEPRPAKSTPRAKTPPAKPSSFSNNPFIEITKKR